MMASSQSPTSWHRAPPFVGNGGGGGSNGDALHCHHRPLQSSSSTSPTLPFSSSSSATAASSSLLAAANHNIKVSQATTITTSNLTPPNTVVSLGTSTATSTTPSSSSGAFFETDDDNSSPEYSVPESPLATSSSAHQSDNDATTTTTRDSVIIAEADMKNSLRIVQQQQQQLFQLPGTTAISVTRKITVDNVITTNGNGSALIAQSQTPKVLAKSQLNLSDSSSSSSSSSSDSSSSSSSDSDSDSDSSSSSSSTSSSNSSSSSSRSSKVSKTSKISKISKVSKSSKTSETTKAPRTRAVKKEGKKEPEVAKPKVNNVAKQIVKTEVVPEVTPKSTPSQNKRASGASVSGGGGMNLRKRISVQAVATTKKNRKRTRIEKSQLNPETVPDHGKNILFTSACYRLRRKPTIKDLFPLRSVGGVLALFKAQLSKEIDGQVIDSLPEPDLLMLSVVIGMLEDRFASGAEWTPEFDSHNSAADIRQQNVPVVPGYVKGRRLLEMPVPPIYWSDVAAAMKKFTLLIKESVDLTQYPGPTSRELIKRISEVIWANLLRSYQRDKLHIQTIYSLVESQRLDAFGVAYAVVAACQVLNIPDVYLVLSEDHSWVEFGPNHETCEVTWHGKQGGDEKFGQSIPLDSASWIYQNGHTLTCDLKTAAAVLVTSINATVANNVESEELASLQHQLLWYMYDIRLLNRYPIAIGTLADLEDTLMPDFPRREPIELFHEAIVSAKKYYNDSHVYPYTFLAGFHFRNGRFKAAFRYWGDAAQVMKHYNHNRDDEEIYKEFQEIGNDLIPYLVKFVSTNDVEPSMDHYLPHLEDPECFAFLLQFYDGLCSWEEGSQTPVLHVGWSKFAVASISKFSNSARAAVQIKFDSPVPEDGDSELEDTTSEDAKTHHSSSIGERRRRRAASINTQSEAYKVAKSLSISSRTTPTIAEDDLSDEDMNLSSNVSSDGSGTHVTLYSKKMAGMKSLLTALKLNTSAIQLQLTAQSQVNVNKRHRIKSNSTKPELDFVATTNTNLIRTSSDASSQPSDAKRTRRA